MQARVYRCLVLICAKSSLNYAMDIVSDLHLNYTVCISLGGLPGGGEKRREEKRGKKENSSLAKRLHARSTSGKVTVSVLFSALHVCFSNKGIILDTQDTSTRVISPNYYKI